MTGLQEQIHLELRYVRSQLSWWDRFRWSEWTTSLAAKIAADVAQGQPATEPASPYPKADQEREKQ